MSTSDKFESPIAGTFSCPYKLAIVGGGPSGCSIIVRAVRIAVISELCSYSYPQTTPPNDSSTSSTQPISAGVCLIDAGTPERVGGGRLQDYVINSNTWINKFATNVVEEKPDNLPPETIKNTLFDALNQSAITKLLEGFGNKPGPLKMVGSFLHEVGAIAISTLGQYPDSSKALFYTRVQSMHRVLDVNNRFLCWRLVLVTNSTDTAVDPQRQEIYAQHVALATGGYQPIPILSQSSYRSKLVMSDVAVTLEGVEMINAKLRRHLTAGNINSRIVIIGGSHSAFSAAWICLNLVNEEHPKTGPLDFNNPADIATLKASTYLPSISLTPNDKIRIGPSGICLLHRSAIRVFYATRHEAEHDHYFDPNTMCVNKVTGQINTFGGIRGDAKELWKAVRSGRETRMRLLQVKTAMSATTAATGASNGVKQSIVDKMMDEAAVIIWAGGYASNMPEVYDGNGQAIPFSMFKGQVNVDDHAQLLLSDSSPLIIGRGVIPPQSSQVIEHLYGSGLGFGLKATLDNGEPDGSSGRADGVAVYLKRGATLILANVLGNKVYGGSNISSWEERNQTLRKHSLSTTVTQAAADSTTSEEGVAAAVEKGSVARASTAVKSPSKRPVLQQLQSFSNNNNVNSDNTGTAMPPTRVNSSSTNPWSPNSSMKNRAMSAGRVGLNISAITVGSGGHHVPSSPTNKDIPAAFPLSPSFRLSRGGSSNSSLLTSSPSKKDGVAAVIAEVIAAEAAAASEASTTIISRSTSNADLKADNEKSSSSLFSQSDGHLSAKLALIKASCEPSTSLTTATSSSTSKKVSTFLDLSKSVLKGGIKAAVAAATASAPVTPSRSNNNNNSHTVPSSSSSKKVTPSRASIVINKAESNNIVTKNDTSSKQQPRRTSSVGRAIRISNPKITIPVVAQQPTAPQTTTSIAAAETTKEQVSVS